MGGDELLFFIAKSGDGPVGQVRKLTGLSEVEATPQLLILDIPDNGGYYVAADGMSVADFVASYKKGALERKQLPNRPVERPFVHRANAAPVALVTGNATSTRT